jgi:hypothetical protein
LVVLTGNFANPIRERKTTENKINVDYFFMTTNLFSIRKHDSTLIPEKFHIYLQPNEIPFCSYPFIHWKDTEDYKNGLDITSVDYEIKANDLVCKKCILQLAVFPKKD